MGCGQGGDSSGRGQSSFSPGPAGCGRSQACAEGAALNTATAGARAQGLEVRGSLRCLRGPQNWFWYLKPYCAHRGNEICELTESWGFPTQRWGQNGFLAGHELGGSLNSSGVRAGAHPAVGHAQLVGPACQVGRKPPFVQTDAHLLFFGHVFHQRPQFILKVR